MSVIRTPPSMTTLSIPSTGEVGTPFVSPGRLCRNVTSRVFWSGLTSRKSMPLIVAGLASRTKRRRRASPHRY
jgi:hypothetical protein